MLSIGGQEGGTVPFFQLPQSRQSQSPLQQQQNQSK